MHRVLGPLLQHAVTILSFDTVITYTTLDKKCDELHLRVLLLELPVLSVHVT